MCRPVSQVEMCEALRRSVAALRQEKEALCEEQRHHQALGASIDTLVQERLKTNERDKYSMFIGETADCHNITIVLVQLPSGEDGQILTSSDFVCRRPGEDCEPAAVSVQPAVEDRQISARSGERGADAGGHGRGEGETGHDRFYLSDSLFTCVPIYLPIRLYLVCTGLIIRL